MYILTIYIHTAHIYPRVENRGRIQKSGYSFKKEKKEGGKYHVITGKVHINFLTLNIRPHTSSRPSTLFRDPIAFHQFTVLLFKVSIEFSSFSFSIKPLRTLFALSSERQKIVLKFILKSLLGKFLPL